MRTMSCLAPFLVFTLWVFPLSAQQEKREPLTGPQIEQIREAGIDPPERVKLGILRALAGEPGFDLARKEAIESGEDLADQAKRLLQEQTDYFNLHKDEAGQDRAEPK